MTDDSLRTSVATIAKEKMSASLVSSPPCKTSGAVHRGL